MLDEAETAIRKDKWLLRGLGGGMMWLGTHLCLAWVPSLVGHIPFIGGVARGVVGIALNLLTIGTSLGASLLVIAAAWLRFRPLHASMIGAASLALMFAQRLVLQEMNLPQNV